MKEKKTSSTDWKWISAQGNGHGRDRARSYLIFCIWACSKSVAWDSSKICNIFDDRYECECNLCILFTFITPKISIPMQNYSVYTHNITYFCHDFSFLVLCVVFFLLCIYISKIKNLNFVVCIFSVVLSIKCSYTLWTSV